MTRDEFKKLNRGDIIRHRGNVKRWLVDGNCGDCIIAIDTVHVTNPDEWEIVAKSNYDFGLTDNQRDQ